MMRVLDIDLDLFLADCCPLAPLGERPALQGHEPWPEADVRRFLEDCCGLSTAHPIPGRIFDTHDKALALWQECLKSGTLTAPFHVTHADTHSDLGIGFPGPGAVLNGVLPVRFPDRTDTARYYQRGQLDEANYLLFALAFRHVAFLDNVRNPRSRHDMPKDIAPGADGCFHLTSYASRLMEGLNGPEPAIPYREYADPFAFRADGPYDLMSVAVSPRYAPKEADALLPVLSEYMLPV